VAGALVTLVGADGRPARTAASDGEGRFRVAAPSAGTYRLRVERVGHAAAAAGPVALGADEEREMPIVLAPAPVRLEAVSATAGGRCAANPQRRDGEALARVWDEARKALSLTVRTAEDSLAAFHFTVYERGYTPRLGKITQDRVETRFGLMSRPFASIPAEELAEHGWVHTPPAGEMTFYGPDAEVLLSDLFLERHCFRLKDGAGAEAGMIGLEFEPLPTRRRPDVRGVLWLDRRTSELRHLEFQFVGVTTPRRDVLGGRVDFVRLPTGAWIVRGWSMRVPVAQRRFHEDLSSATIRLGNPQWIKEVGGGVTDAGLARAEPGAP
jgi:hypothetical protein